MKKLLTLILMAGTAAIFAPAATARTAAEPAAAQYVQYERPQRRGVRWGRNRRVRVVTTTRTRWIAGRLFRETIRITYLPNGRRTIRVIRRVRIR